MGIKKLILGLVIAIITISVILSATNRMIQAETSASDQEISDKLDAILKNQKQMLEEIAAMREELYILKIRVTK